MICCGKDDNDAPERRIFMLQNHSALHLKDLYRSYGKHPALSGLSADLELERGRVYGLIGPNGSGKTTLLKLLARILSPSSGHIFLTGESGAFPSAEPPSFSGWGPEHVVYIPAGERGLRYKNTVRDNVMYFCALKGKGPEKTKLFLQRHAASLSCEKLLDRRVESLSLGQKKKTALLCGLCCGARLILMDEPSNGLDPQAEEELKRTIRETARRERVTFLISSHDLLLFEGLADRFLFLSEGRMKFSCDRPMDTEELKEAYAQIGAERGEP